MSLFLVKNFCYKAKKKMEFWQNKMLYYFLVYVLFYLLEFNSFVYCNSLKEISFQKSATSIELNCFSYCYNWSSILILEKVTLILSFTFYKCINLSTITVLGSLYSIGSNEFEDCSNLASFKFIESNAVLDSETLNHLKLIVPFLK